MSDLNSTWFAGTFGPSATILNWNTAGAKSGSLLGITANAPLFAFRNSGSNIAWLVRVAVAFNLTAAFTTAQGVDFGLFVCRSFSASDSGGVQIPLTGTNNCLRRTSQVPFSACDMRMASSAALMLGARMPDAAPVGLVEGWGGAAGAAIPVMDLFAYKGIDYPLVFAPGEGFEVQPLSAMGAGGAGILYLTVTLAEISGVSWPV